MINLKKLYIILLIIGFTVVNSDSIILWDTIFQGARHIVPFIYNFSILIILSLMHKHVYTNKLHSIDILIILFMLITVISYIIAYLNGARINEISNYCRFWLYGGIVYITISRIKLNLIEIKKLFSYILIYSYIVMIGYLYVYMYGELGPNWGHLFNKTESNYKVRIIGDTMYCALIIFTLFSMKLNSVNIKKELYIILPFVVFAILIHKTRAFVISLTVTFIILVIIENKKLRIKFLKFIIFIIIASINIIIINYIYSGETSDFYIRIYEMFIGLGDIATYQSRLQENKFVMDIFINNNKIFGIGLGSNLILQSIETGQYVKEDMWGIHNTYLTILATMGIIGLLLYLCIWMAVLYKFMINKNTIINNDLKYINLVCVLIIITKLIQGIGTNGSDGSTYVAMVFFAGLSVNIMRFNKRELIIRRNL